MDVSRFTLTNEKGVVLAAPCLELVAFSYRPAAECGPGFTQFLREVDERCGGRFAFYRTGDMKRGRPFSAAALAGPYHWFAETQLLATKKLGLFLHAGPAERQILPPALHLALIGFDTPPCFVFRLMLPVEAAEAPDDVLAFVQRALAEFPLASGHVGFSFVWERTDLAVEKTACDWAAPLMLRHPGLGYGSPVRLSNAADKGVVAIGWLTLLGDALTAELGGRDALAQRAPAGLEVRPLGAAGALLRAGAAPQLGDVDRQDLLPAYHAAGRLVAPRRATDDGFDNVVVLGMAKATAQDWLRRFFV